jgi:glycosyltransferase involved in cell wall biosynthesis
MSVTLSVVIPVYNGAAFIADTVRAALAQTFRDFEIVIVNDGSRDATLEQLAPFGDTIKVISIPNNGVSNARNVGIRASSGEFIAFLDADDLWHPEKLQRQLDAMRKYSDIGFSCSNFAIIDPVSGLPAAHFDQFRRDPELVLDSPLADPLAVLIKYNFVGTCSNVMVRRDVLERVGLFDPRYRQTEDYDLWLRCAGETDFLVMSEVLLDKTKHETNLTNNFVETLEYHDMVLQALLHGPLIAKRPQLTPAVRRAIASVRYGIGNRLFRRGQISSGYKYFWSAWRQEFSLANSLYFAIQVSKKTGRLVLEALRLREPLRD